MPVRALLRAGSAAALAGVCVLAGSPAGAQEGGWGWPVPPPPVLGRAFEAPAHRWAAGHRGVDLVAPVGADVRAAGGGTVVFAGLVAGRPVVSVAHGELRTTYEPVVPAVRAGARVASGDVLGQLAAAGSHCAPRACLHWGARRGTEYLDPLLLLGAGPPRLLPLWSGEGSPATPAGAPASPPAAAGFAVRGSAAMAAAGSWLGRQLAA
ncbi:MAG: M23 family metallopeptidase [Actinomycetota bacterium]|nr:M23 family metallopeptidase [Actinomycetota bacterium]